MVQFGQFVPNHMFGGPEKMGGPPGSAQVLHAVPDMLRYIVSSNQGLVPRRSGVAGPVPGRVQQAVPTASSAWS
jgi:hypothetical protein